MAKHRTSNIKHQTSKRELGLAFAGGLAAALVTGAAVAGANASWNHALSAVVASQSAAPPPALSTPEAMPLDPGAGDTLLHEASCSGGTQVDFELRVSPSIKGNRVQVTGALSNRTQTELEVATIVQLVALDGTVMQALPAAVVGKASSDATIQSPISDFVSVPEGYYTLHITALGAQQGGRSEGERTTEAVLYLQSDGDQVRVVDYAEWYFNSGAVEFGPDTQEEN